MVCSVVNTIGTGTGNNISYETRLTLSQFYKKLTLSQNRRYLSNSPLAKIWFWTNFPWYSIYRFEPVPKFILDYCHQITLNFIFVYVVTIGWESFFPITLLKPSWTRLRKAEWWRGFLTSICTSRPPWRRQTWERSVCSWPWTCCMKR